MIITVSGPPGSGKTTVARLLSEKLYMKLVTTGSIFRAMAVERGVSLAEFGEIAKKDQKIDNDLDERTVKLARENEDIILEGRLTAHMLTEAGVPCFRIFITASHEIRASRIQQREGGSLEKRMAEMEERAQCERERYSAVYGIDIDDHSIYDMVIDSGDKDPEAITGLIIKRIDDR